MSKNRVRTLPDPINHLSLFTRLMELEAWKKHEQENYGGEQITGIESVIDDEITAIKSKLKGQKEDYWEKLCHSMEKNSLVKLYRDPRFVNADHNDTALRILEEKISNEFCLMVDTFTIAKNEHLNMIVPRPVVMGRESVREIGAFAEMLSDSYRAGRKHYSVPTVEYDDEFVMEVVYLCDSALQLIKMRHSYDKSNPDDVFGKWVLFDGNDLPLGEFDDAESCILFPLDEWNELIGDDGLGGA